MRISIKYYAVCIMHMSFGLKGLLKLLAFLLLTTYYLLLTTPAYAKSETTTKPPPGGIINARPPGADTGIDIGEKFGFGDLGSLGQATNQLITPAFSIAAVLVIIYFLLGAFKYLKSGGDKEEVAGARQMITHAIVGFLILMFAFLILQFLLSSLFGITGFLLFQL